MKIQQKKKPFWKEVFSTLKGEVSSKYLVKSIKLRA